MNIPVVVTTGLVLVVQEMPQHRAGLPGQARQ
jgi:hypothetical protein